MTEIVILGLGTSGFFAAKSSLITNRDSKITVIEKRAYDMFSPCGLPVALEGLVEFEKLKYKVPEMKNLTKLLAHEAVEIKPREKLVVVKDLNSSKTKDVRYDKLIIATGSLPSVPKIRFSPELLHQSIHLVSNIEDTKLLAAQSSAASSALIVGAGAIGLEIAFALANLNKEVLVVEKENQLLPNNLDEDMSKVVEEKLREKKLNFRFGSQIELIAGTKKIEFVALGGEKIATDLIVFCTGNIPNIKLAKEAGLELGTTGGIKVNSKLETSASDIYACGDCAETYSFITKKPILARLASVAYKQGEIAGINAAGGSASYKGALGAFATKLGEIEIGAVGLNSVQAAQAGFKVVGVKTRSRTKPNFMPGSEEIIMKIIFDEKTQKLLGAQAIGGNGAWRTNLIALAIQNECTSSDLKNLELSYSPSLSEVYDILPMLGDFWLRKLHKREQK